MSEAPGLPCCISRKQISDFWFLFDKGPVQQPFVIIAKGDKDRYVQFSGHFFRSNHIHIWNGLIHPSNYKKDALLCMFFRQCKSYRSHTRNIMDPAFHPGLPNWILASAFAEFCWEKVNEHGLERTRVPERKMTCVWQWLRVCTTWQFFSGLRITWTSIGSSWSFSQKPSS